MWPRALLLVLLVGTVRLVSAEEGPRPATPKRSYRSDNFVVSAPTGKLARQIAEAAEKQRKDVARFWLGKELPPWPHPCPIRITLSEGRPNGTGAFTFYDGKLLSLELHLQGTRAAIFKGTLAHEMTHAILATHFRRPVPRWADEGAAMLSEGPEEGQRWATILARVLDKPGRALPLRRLFNLSGYPRDLDAFYAQSYSVTDFLVESKGRTTFLAFVGDGMKDGWERPLQAHYGYRNPEELERAWLKHERGRPRRHREKPKSARCDLSATPR